MKRLWLLLLLLAVPFFVVAQKKPSIDQLKNDLKKIEEKKDKVQDKLDTTNDVIKDVRGDIGEVDMRLEGLESQLEQTGEQLLSAQARQQSLGESLKAAEEQLAQKQTEVKRRLRAMYKRGQTTTISALLGLASSGDIASRQFILDRIAKRDRKLFEDYVAVRERFLREKIEQDGIVAKISGLVQSQERQQLDLVAVRDEKARLLSSLNDKQDELERIVRQFDDDSNAIEKQISDRMEAAFRVGKDLPPIGDGKFGPPAGGRQTSRFGMRFHPILKYNRMHNGIDFGGGYGAPVYATGDGVVVSTSRLGGYGNAIIIEHGGGIASVYGHLSRIMVQSGSSVKRGQRIGSIGSSGLSTGPHLHFEIRQNGRPVDPNRYL